MANPDQDWARIPPPYPGKLGTRGVAQLWFAFCLPLPDSTRGGSHADAAAILEDPDSTACGSGRIASSCLPDHRSLLRMIYRYPTKRLRPPVIGFARMLCGHVAARVLPCIPWPNLVKAWPECRMGLVDVVW